MTVIICCFTAEATSSNTVDALNQANNVNNFDSFFHLNFSHIVADSVKVFRSFSRETIPLKRFKSETNPTQYEMRQVPQDSREDNEAHFQLYCTFKEKTQTSADTLILQ